MRRREFIAGLGSAAAWPVTARAQQRALPVIGLLSGVSFEGIYTQRVEDIRRGLREVGFVERQNVLIDYQSAEGRPERLRNLVAELIDRQVMVIVAIGGSNAALAAKATTSTIPIVFATGGDAVENGLVKSLNKPEGNVTGMSFIIRQLAPKHLDLLRELVPQARLIGYLDNVATESEIARIDFISSARSIGREIRIFYAGTEQEIERAFASMIEQRIQAVIVSGDAYLATRQEQIIALAKLYALPAAGASALLGGLISSEVQLGEVYRQAGIYAGRILKGEKPGDLPVQLPTKFKLGMNLKTAKALGLEVPPTLLAVADEVIE